MAQSHRGPDPVMSSSRPSIDLRTGEVVILEDIEPFVGGEVDLIDVGAAAPLPGRRGAPPGALRRGAPMGRSIVRLRVF